MKRNKVFAVGLALGLVFSMSFQVFASPVLQKIEAYINQGITYQFDGVKKVVPSEYKTITYEGRTYAPVRFVAENLGATVEWDEKTQVISIISPKPLECNTTTTAASVLYSPLPIYKVMSTFNITLRSLYKDTYGKYRIYCTLENKGAIPIQLDQLASKVIVDGKEYSMLKQTLKNLDYSWYDDIYKDKRIEGYISLPDDIVDPEKIHIELKIRENTYPSKEFEPLVFDIDAKGKP